LAALPGTSPSGLGSSTTVGSPTPGSTDADPRLVEILPGHPSSNVPTASLRATPAGRRPPAPASRAAAARSRSPASRRPSGLRGRHDPSRMRSALPRRSWACARHASAYAVSSS
jgi:hypothetical protein